MSSRVVMWFVLLAGVPALSSAQTKSVWAGVYTDAQAARGEAVYRRICSLCHGPTLDGTESAPELRGSALFKPYYGKPVGDLFTSVRDKMPKDAPGTLTPQQVADVLAYVFKANKMPAGPDEVAVSAAALADIVIAPRPQ
jgi:mono/diheme cytochrome c family protein